MRAVILQLCLVLAIAVPSFASSSVPREKPDDLATVNCTVVDAEQRG